MHELRYIVRENIGATKKKEVVDRLDRTRSKGYGTSIISDAKF